jgi:hypothetical protein
LGTVLYPGDFPVDVKPLVRRQGRIIAPHCHKLHIPTLPYLPVDQLIGGHWVPVGIERHLVPVTREVHPPQSLQDLGFGRARERERGRERRREGKRDGEING